MWCNFFEDNIVLEYETKEGSPLIQPKMTTMYWECYFRNKQPIKRQVRLKDKELQQSAWFKYQLSKWFKYKKCRHCPRCDAQNSVCLTQIEKRNWFYVIEEFFLRLKGNIFLDSHQIVIWMLGLYKLHHSLSRNHNRHGYVSSTN